MVNTFKNLEAITLLYFRSQFDTKKSGLQSDYEKVLIPEINSDIQITWGVEFNWNIELLSNIESSSLLESSLDY